MKLPLLFSFSHSFFPVSTHKSKVFFLKFSFFFFKKGLLYLNLQCLFIFYFFTLFFLFFYSFFPLFLFFFYSFFILFLFFFSSFFILFFLFFYSFFILFLFLMIF